MADLRIAKTSVQSTVNVVCRNVHWTFAMDYFHWDTGSCYGGTVTWSRKDIQLHLDVGISGNHLDQCIFASQSSTHHPYQTQLQYVIYNNLLSALALQSAAERLSPSCQMLVQNCQNSPACTNVSRGCCHGQPQGSHAHTCFHDQGNHQPLF